MTNSSVFLIVLSLKYFIALSHLLKPTWIPSSTLPRKEKQSNERKIYHKLNSYLWFNFPCSTMIRINCNSIASAHSLLFQMQSLCIYTIALQMGGLVNPFNITYVYSAFVTQTSQIFPIFGFLFVDIIHWFFPITESIPIENTGKGRCLV